MDKPIQETTSSYFNSILKKSVEPVTVENIVSEILNTFNMAIEEALVVKDRIKYHTPYIIHL